MVYSTSCSVRGHRASRAGVGRTCCRGTLTATPPNSSTTPGTLRRTEVGGQVLEYVGSTTPDKATGRSTATPSIALAHTCGCIDDSRRLDPEKLTASGAWLPAWCNLTCAADELPPVAPKIHRGKYTSRATIFSAVDLLAIRARNGMHAYLQPVSTAKGLEGRSAGWCTSHACMSNNSKTSGNRCLKEVGEMFLKDLGLLQVTSGCDRPQQRRRPLGSTVGSNATSSCTRESGGVSAGVLGAAGKQSARYVMRLESGGQKWGGAAEGTGCCMHAGLDRQKESTFNATKW
jgi:hypothetical protein